MSPIPIPEHSTSLGYKFCKAKNPKLVANYFLNVYLLIYLLTYFWPRGSLLPRGLVSCCGAQASHCRGFSCWGARALGCAGVSSCGSQALVRACMLSRVQLFAPSWTVAHQGSSACGILQARMLEWVAISSSRGSSRLRDQTHISHISCTAGGFFTTLPPGKPLAGFRAQTQ